MAERQPVSVKEKLRKFTTFDTNRKVEGVALVGLGFFAGYCGCEITQDPKVGLAVGLLCIATIYWILGIDKEAEQENKIEVKQIEVNVNNPKKRY